MPICVVCTQCHTALEVSEAAAGRKGRCPTCQAVMDIPRAGHTTSDAGTARGDTILVRCSECGMQLQVDAASAGKKGRCPHCQAISSIPNAAGQRGMWTAESIVVTCLECQTPLQVSASAAGKKGRCPNCRAVMAIPPLPGSAEPERQRSPRWPVAAPQSSESANTIHALVSPLPVASTEPSTLTRYVPATSREAMDTNQPAGAVATPSPSQRTGDRGPLKTYDENALLELPPGEPPPRPPEPETEAATAAAPEPPPTPPPVIERRKNPSASPSPGKRVPPQLIRPPLQQPAVPPQTAGTKSPMAVDLETIAPLTQLAAMTAAPAAAPRQELPSSAPGELPPTAPVKSTLPQSPKPPVTLLTKPPTIGAASAGTSLADRGRPAPVTATTAPVAAAAVLSGTQASVPAVTGSREQLAAQILESFRAPIAKTPPSMTYKLGILLTTAVMIVVPLIYIGLILMMGLVVVWHLTANVGMITAVSGRGQFLALIVYLMPAVVGALLVLFMVKPLFAPAGDHEKTRPLTRDAEPLLFAFVERVCATVDAPVPNQIEVCCDVNAGARLQGFGSGDLALQIGMPLVAGLSLQQFAGVLAHEFGHFSQGAGMRLTYLTRRIDLWLIRVVYERDRWDDWLESASHSVHLSIGWALHLLRFLVWGTRWILRLLLIVGHAVTGFMLREMEYDADRFEARLAGSDTFEATVRQLIYLNLAYQGAQADLENFYRDGRLADNLPRLIIANVGQLPNEARKFTDEMIEQTETGTFDSHPADRDRIASARSENAPGVFHSRLPATVLFQDFDGLAKAVTWDLYTEHFGAEFKPTAVRPIEEMLERQSREDQIYDAMKRFLLDSFQVLRPLRVPEWYLRPPTHAAQVQDLLAGARNAMHAQIAAYNQAWEWYDKADTRVIQMRQLVPLMRCYAKIMADKFEFLPANAEIAGYERDRAYADMTHLDGQLVPLETAAGQRLHAALWLLYDPQFASRLADARELLDHCQRLMPLVGRINNHLAQINELRTSGAILAALAGHIDDNDKNEGLFQEIIDQLQRSRRQLHDVWVIFQREAYPFDHQEGFMSISHFLLKELPKEEELGGTLDGIDQLLGNLASLYRRSLARLCYVAERVEKALGWDPLPLPEKPTSS